MIIIIKWNYPGQVEKCSPEYKQYHKEKLCHAGTIYKKRKTSALSLGFI